LLTAHLITSAAGKLLRKDDQDLTHRKILNLSVLAPLPCTQGNTCAITLYNY